MDKKYMIDSDFINELIQTRLRDLYTSNLITHQTYEKNLNDIKEIVQKNKSDDSVTVYNISKLISFGLIYAYLLDRFTNNIEELVKRSKSQKLNLILHQIANLLIRILILNLRNSMH